MAPYPQKKRQHSFKKHYPFKRQLRRKFNRFLFILLVAALASAVNYYHSHQTSNSTESSGIDPSLTTPYFTQKQQQQAITLLLQSKNKTKAQFWVGLNAIIVQKLKDDLSGSRHQKFIISPTQGVTLLVSHNIDLAERIPMNTGDEISLYGRYEWNTKGGVIHWTHHDPRDNSQGGWIRANNKVYR